MNNIYKFIIPFILLCNFGVVKAQNNKDHLEPSASIYDIYDYKFDYYSKVRKVLFNGLTDSPEIRFQVMPSFTPENVLDIEYDTDNEKYFIVYHICEKMIWYNKEWDEIKVDKYKTEIDKKSVDLLKLLFDVAISQTKFYEKENLRTDGTEYFFSINKYGLKSGAVWSPSKGTQMKKLVDIGYKLIELSKSKEPTVKIDGELRKETEQLITELN